MFHSLLAIIAILSVGTCLALAADAPPATQPASIHDFTMKPNAENAKAVPLSQYKGKVLLVVNTASRCGLTKQYAELEALYQANKEKGLAILAFPANDFGKQEPGTDAEIRQFCSEKYNVSFDLFAKTAVTGAEINPLYKWLTDPAANPKTAGPIKWNFTKFLVGKDGQVVARFEPKVKPSDKPLTDAIEAELTKPEK